MGLILCAVLAVLPGLFCSWVTLLVTKNFRTFWQIACAIIAFAIVVPLCTYGFKLADDYETARVIVHDKEQNALLQAEGEVTVIFVHRGATGVTVSTEAGRRMVVNKNGHIPFEGDKYTLKFYRGTVYLDKRTYDSKLNQTN